MTFFENFEEDTAPRLPQVAVKHFTAIKNFLKFNHSRVHRSLQSPPSQGHNQLREEARLRQSSCHNLSTTQHHNND
jgi:hypothetical protein